MKRKTASQELRVENDRTGRRGQLNTVNNYLKFDFWEYEEERCLRYVGPLDG